MENSKINKWAGTLLPMILFFPAINYFLNIWIQTIMKMDTKIVTQCIYMFLAVIAVISYYFSIKKSKTRKVLAVVLVLYFYYFFAVPQNRTVMFSGDWYDLVYNPFYPLFIQCIPAFLMVLLLKDVSNFIDKSMKYSVFIILLAVVAYYFVVKLQYISKIEYMTFSYNLLLPTTFCAYYGMEKRKRMYTLLSLIATAVIIISGSRGAAVCALSMYVLMLIYTSNKNITVTRIMLFFILAVVVILLIINFESILIGIGDILEKYNISSRTIDKLLDGTINDQSGRDSIRKTILAGFKNMPASGYGLYGDRKLAGTYAHNFFFEIICQFGFIIGSVILVLIGICMIKAILKNGSREVKTLFVISLPGFLKMFFSGSYLQDSVFWLFFGAMILCAFQKGNAEDDTKLSGSK